MCAIGLSRPHTSHGHPGPIGLGQGQDREQEQYQPNSSKLNQNLANATACKTPEKACNSKFGVLKLPVVRSMLIDVA